MNSTLFKNNKWYGVYWYGSALSKFKFRLGINSRVKVKTFGNILILSTFFSLVFLKITWASSNYKTTVFNRANVYYEQAKYDEAIREYNSILESGWESGNLYYNLGNCYFKKGKLGQAIFYYEKARRLIPLDKDLESNYEYALSLVKGSIVVPKAILPVRLWNNFFEKITIDGLAILLSVFFIGILASILISFFFKAVKKQVLFFAIFLGLCFIAGFVGLKGKISLLNKEAIVITDKVDAKFEPLDSATTHFTLYEGMKVEVVEARDKWYKIKRQDNKSGWVQYSAIFLLTAKAIK